MSTNAAIVSASSRRQVTTIVFIWTCLLGTLLVSSSAGGEVTASEGEKSFRLARPGYAYHFPRDHGSHDEFRTEWWYYTGHLLSQRGRRFGFQLTFFRRAIQQNPDQPNLSRWTIHHLYFAHFALTDVDAGEFQYAEKLSRAALGKAGAKSGGLHVWIDRWAVEASDNGLHHLIASTDEFAIDLHLTPEKPPIIHGHDGISKKGDRAGQASHYYSLTRLATTGTVIMRGEPLAVQGLSWMDHEFGSTDLGADQVGWDWFSVQLNDHSEVMLYLLRRADGTSDPASSGTFLSPDGQPRHLSLNDVRVKVLDHWASDVSGAHYPSHWRISIPALDLSLTVRPLVAGQELVTGKSTQVTYWEGAVTVVGTRGRTSLSGQGYVELTGYAKPFNRQL